MFESKRRHKRDLYMKNLTQLERLTRETLIDKLFVSDWYLINIVLTSYNQTSMWYGVASHLHGVASTSRLLKIIGLFRKRAL